MSEALAVLTTCSVILVGLYVGGGFMFSKEAGRLSALVWLLCSLAAVVISLRTDGFTSGYALGFAIITMILGAAAMLISTGAE